MGEQIKVLGQPLVQRINRVIDLAGGERPAILGHQAVWWIMNDRGNEHLSSGSDTEPIGLEVHAMAFAFDTSGDIDNTTFYKYNFFYKGTEPFTDAYIGLFSDPDLGNFDDDWVGSDTTLGMGFVYNSDNFDEGGSGYGESPPALGYDLLQGPIVPSPGDSAFFDGQRIPDFRNLKMSHFLFYNGGGGVTEVGATEVYNYLQGRWWDGQQITFGGAGRDFSGIPADFMFPGDPVTCAFWSECNSDDQGTSIGPADRRFVMSSGPFTIKPGDFQQIVFGIVWALGEDNLNSVASLRQAVALAQLVFEAGFNVAVPTATAVEDPDTGIPITFQLSPNYPNPFNPATMIRFGLPMASDVKVTIYNVLGQRLATLVEGRFRAGWHTVRWEARGLPSGAYLYRMTAGSFSEARVMVLLR